MVTGTPGVLAVVDILEKKFYSNSSICNLLSRAR